MWSLRSEWWTIGRILQNICNLLELECHWYIHQLEDIWKKEKTKERRLVIRILWNMKTFQFQKHLCDKSYLRCESSNGLRILPDYSSAFCTPSTVQNSHDPHHIDCSCCLDSDPTPAQRLWNMPMPDRRIREKLRLPHTELVSVAPYFHTHNCRTVGRIEPPAAAEELFDLIQLEIDKNELNL